MAKLETRVAELLRDKRQLTKKTNSQAKTIAAQEARIEALMELNRSLAEEKTGLGRELCTLQKSHKTQLTANRSLEKKVTALTKAKGSKAKRIAAQEKSIERLKKRLGELRTEAKIPNDSLDGSNPPANDPPKSRAERRRIAKEYAKKKAMLKPDKPRNPGKQPGAKGFGRKMLPLDQVDEVVPHYPDSCTCGHCFTEAEKLAAHGRYGRHQVTELREKPTFTTEHQTHQMRCPDCKARITAKLPLDVPQGAFGPRLQASIVAQTISSRISRDGMVDLATDLLKSGLSAGTVENICKNVGKILASGPHGALVSYVHASEAVGVDETGWLTAGDPRALLVANCKDAAIFKIVESRWVDFLEDILGEASKALVTSDRWFIYNRLDVEQRQVCWEHLKRDFIKHSEYLTERKEFGEQGLELTRQLFQIWHSFGEHKDRNRLQAEMLTVQDALRALLEEAARRSARTKGFRRFADNLLTLWPALWTFVTTEGIEPTNNASERALRGPVILRKLSQGTRNEEGEKFMEMILSAAVTCRLQHRSLYEYLVELIIAYNRGDPLPDLVPVTTTASIVDSTLPLRI